MPVRGVANASKSLIGLEDETNNAVPSAISAAIVLAMTASFQPSKDSINL